MTIITDRKIVQKRAILGFLTGALLFFPFASQAALYFTPNSPQDVSIQPTAFSTSGYSFDVFDANGAFIEFQNSGSVFPTVAIEGTLPIVECDTSVPLSNCTTPSNLASIRLDPGYISETTYTFTSSSSTVDTAEVRTELFMIFVGMMAGLFVILYSYQIMHQ